MRTLRNSTLLTVLIACAFIWNTGCFRMHPKSSRIKSTATVKTNSAKPPAHAKAHGVRGKISFHYHPDFEVYFNPISRNYYWMESDVWKIGVRLPNTIVIDTNNFVTLELDDADKPYSTHSAIVKKHPGKKLGHYKEKHKEKHKDKGKSKGKGKAKGKAKGKNK